MYIIIVVKYIFKNYLVFYSNTSIFFLFCKNNTLKIVEYIQEYKYNKCNYYFYII